MNKKHLIIGLAIVFLVGITSLIFNIFEPDNISRSKWKMASVETNGKIESLISFNTVVEFNDGKISGVICNSFSGNYEIKGDKLIARELVSTKRACENPIGTIENNFFSSLNIGVSWNKPNQNELRISDELNSRQFIFNRE